MDIVKRAEHSWQMAFLKPAAASIPSPAAVPTENLNILAQEEGGKTEEGQTAEQRRASFVTACKKAEA